MRTLILSDLHLGSKNSHTHQLLETLTREPCDRVILNGDTINSLNLRKFKDRHWRVLDKLREMAKSREVVLVRGNHDYDPRAECNGCYGPHQVLPTLLGVPMVEEYKLAVGSRSYLVMHGDRFDPTLNYTLVSEMAGWCYEVSQKLNKKLAKWLKKKSKRWTGVLEWVRSRSVEHARKQGFEGIVTGHTHFADDLHIDGMHYVNSGCWTEPPCAYLVADSAKVSLHEVAD
jgi:UDP-2,3-diacylglucosamine pyrophosphatase LpxH